MTRTTVKERPILFSGPMVRAILEGRKTQTRRVILGVPAGAECAGVVSSPRSIDGEWWWLDDKDLADASVIGEPFRCPYGQPGDLLWVRETHYVESAGYKDGTGRLIFYRADDETNYVAEGTWTPSIFMPRWACRLVLRVTDVRVQRLQEISEEDAQAEGTRASDAAIIFAGDAEGRPRIQSELSGTYRGAFACLWDSINAKRAPWASNPFVWAMTFERVEQEKAA